jgi:ABC-type sugar transport system substrate-binding protein
MGGGTGLLGGASGAAGVSAPANALALSAPSSGGGFMSSLQPFMQAANSASQVKGLLGDGGSQPMQAPQVAQGNPAGAQTLAQLYQQGMQMSPEDQARLQRKSMWG